MAKRRSKPPERGPAMQQFSLKIPSDLVEAIRARAEAEGRTPSNMARRLLELGVGKASA